MHYLTSLGHSSGRIFLKLGSWILSQGHMCSHCHSQNLIQSNTYLSNSTGFGTRYPQDTMQEAVLDKRFLEIQNTGRWVGAGGALEGVRGLEMKLENTKFMVLERVLLRLHWGDAKFCCAAAFSSRDDDAFEVHFLTQSQSQTWINDLPTPSSPNRHLRIRLRMLQYTWRKFSYTLNNSLEICHCSWQAIWVFSGYVYNRISGVFIQLKPCLP